MARDIHWSHETISLVSGQGTKPISKQFQRILARYCPPPARILDLTAGSLTLWHRVSPSYHLVLADKKPRTKDIIKFDMERIPWEQQFNGELGGKFDALILDTPYQFSPGQWENRIRVTKLGVSGGVDHKYREHEVSWEFETFLACMRALNMEAPKLLVTDGLLLTKIMTTHHKGEFYPNQSIIWSLLSNLTQIDERITRIQSAGGFSYSERAKKNHLRFMLFRNRKPRIHLHNIL